MTIVKPAAWFSLLAGQIVVLADVLGDVVVQLALGWRHLDAERLDILFSGNTGPVRLVHVVLQPADHQVVEGLGFDL